MNWSNILNEIRYRGYSDESIAQATGWNQRRVYDCRIGKRYATGKLIDPPEEKQHKIISLHRFVKDLPHKPVLRNNIKPKKDKTLFMIETINGFQVG